MPIDEPHPLSAHFSAHGLAWSRPPSHFRDDWISSFGDYLLGIHAMDAGWGYSIYADNRTRARGFADTLADACAAVVELAKVLEVDEDGTATAGASGDRAAPEAAVPPKT